MRMEKTNTRLLIVDDDAPFLDMLGLSLEGEGYEVLRGSDGDDALRLVPQHRPALLICDVNMPRVDGFTVCRRLRAASETLPIVLLTTRDSDVDEALGLDLGADDYLSKPFRHRVLIARIEALLRRERMRDEATTGAPVAVGALHIDPQRLEVRFRDQLIDFTVTEFRLLQGFAERPGLVLSRTRLLELMRDDYDTFVDERMVDSYVRRLRRKLGAVSTFEAIETVVGAGYRWTEDAL